MQIDQNYQNKCFIITKDNFNLFDLEENKIIETLNFNKLIDLYQKQANYSNFNNKIYSNPVKICSDISKIDPNQVI